MSFLLQFVFLHERSFAGYKLLSDPKGKDLHSSGFSNLFFRRNTQFVITSTSFRKSNQ